MVVHEVFKALAGVCENSDAETIYECLKAAKEVAICRQNYQLAASLRDLSVALTNNFKPQVKAESGQ